MAKGPKETLLERERFELKPKLVGGLLSYEVWGFQTQGKTVVTRYNLAYIVYVIHRGDNGRGLGFDISHGYYHRDSMGNVESVELESFEVTQERVQQEWLEIEKPLEVENHDQGCHSH